MVLVFRLKLVEDIQSPLRILAEEKMERSASDSESEMESKSFSVEDDKGLDDFEVHSTRSSGYRGG